MIATSRTGKLAALVLASVAHAAIALAFFDEEPVLIEGGGAVQEARVGASFADMTSGTLAPVQAEEPAEPVPPKPVAEEASEPVERSEPEEVLAPEPEATKRAEPKQTAAPEPGATERAEPVDADLAMLERAEVLAPVAAKTAPHEERLTALAPELSHGPLRASPAASAAPESAAPASPEATEPAEATETIAATDSESGAVTQSPRPQPRRAEAERTQPRTPPPPTPRGNAEQDSTAGAATGRQQATATRQGSDARTAAESGNAAASNYPGLVSRHLARVRKPPMSRRGAARVAFTVSGSGGLSSLSVVQPSGSQRIDRAALDLIRRAAPFPAPPAGARRDFAVVVEFR